MRSLFIAMTRNVISLLGVAVTSASAVIIITLVILDFIGLEGNPYIGILAYMILPGIFLMGLVLIPIGIARERRAARRAEERGEPPPSFPIIDLNRDRTRRLVLVVLILTLANVIILATATYKGVEVMESAEFCGETCHVMDPEKTAYAGSPHSRVRCVECHIGPGADWFVKSKLSGAWQVVATTFDLYPRPIPTPIHNLRPARETCEHCHWPDKFVGDRLKVITRYSDDEANTETKTVLLLRVGGIQGRVANGIHWHVDPGNRIRYLADEKRETVYDVEMTLADGTVKTFKTPSNAGEGVDGTSTGVWRDMDCVDCHNRPTHVYRMPDEAIDLALSDGRLNRELPYVRREGYRLLRQQYASHEEAREGIAEGLQAFYRESYPDLAASERQLVEEAGQVLGAIYSRNVFPAMNVTWGTYPDHIGHERFPGCFRCHNDEHAADDGELISQNCYTCHTLLAMEEEEPEILEMLQP